MIFQYVVMFIDPFVIDVSYVRDVEVYVGYELIHTRLYLLRL